MSTPEEGSSAEETANAPEAETYTRTYSRPAMTAEAVQPGEPAELAGGCGCGCGAEAGGGSGAASG